MELLRPGHVRREVPGHRTSTRHVRALYPFQAESALPALGPVIGQTSYGHAFLYDAFELYARRLISSPNMAVLGQLGKGKSGFLKAYLFRQHVFGRHAAVLDVKGEYAKLAHLIGGTVVGSAETDEGWVYDGFRATTGSEEQSFFNAYIAENRP